MHGPELLQNPIGNAEFQLSTLVRHGRQQLPTQTARLHKLAMLSARTTLVAPPSAFGSLQRRREPPTDSSLHSGQSVAPWEPQRMTRA